MSSRRLPRNAPFSEREFYLREFHGRTLAIALPAPAAEAVAPVVKELGANGCRTLLMAADRASLSRLAPAPLQADAPRLEAELWRALRERGVAGVLPAPDRPFREGVLEIASRLGVFKLVWLDPGGGLRLRDGSRESFVHLQELEGWLAAEGAALESLERLPLWRDVAALLHAGVSAVNVCAPEGLAEELFTYAGSGTLFTRERYMTVRRLGIDDFDAASDLIQRGVEEGFLAVRPPEQVDQILASGFGAFVEGRDLAGIGALRPLEDGRAAEIASLYTLTRFLGEGVGHHLLAYAIEAAQRRGFGYVFACTTSERVGAFFERYGLREVPREQVPAAKWEGYDPERLGRVRCFRRDLSGAEAAGARRAGGGL